MKLLNTVIFFCISIINYRFMGGTYLPNLGNDPYKQY